jgi:hypothetical protein
VSDAKVGRKESEERSIVGGSVSLNLSNVLLLSAERSRSAVGEILYTWRDKNSLNTKNDNQDEKLELDGGGVRD